MTDQELVQILALVSTYWPHFQLPDDRQELLTWRKAWGRLLSDLDNAAVVAAVDSLAAEARDFAPPPGVIRHRAVQLQAGPGAPGVDEAWAEVQAEIARVGWTVALDPDRKPLFSHPSISAAVDAMGWQTLCESENPMADRAHFIKLYGTATERATRDTVMPASVRELLDGAGPKALSA
jgi:hypothetical protein